MVAAYSAELLARREAQVGEGPVWIAGNVLSWVDITAGRWHRTPLAGGEDTIVDTGGMLGAIVPGAGDWVAADESGFTFRDDAGCVVRRIPVLGDAVRMNDAACDPRGRLWAGSTEYGFAPGGGALHRLDHDGIVTTVLEDLSQPNGLGWNPAGDVLYLIDTVERVLWALDADDVARGRDEVVRWPEGSIPDGLAVDVDGGIWVAMWGAGEVRRYAPDGALDSRVVVPVSQPASCAFIPGGELVITTARLHLTTAQLAGEPLAGSLFVADVGVEGLPVTPFAAAGWP